MQIYTKILIGMAVGAFVGFTLGPNSGLLEKDAYRIGDPTTLTFLVDRHNPQSRVVIGARHGKLKPASILFEIVEIERGSMIGKEGVPLDVPVWAKVRFELSERLVMRDKDGSLRSALGDPKIGSDVEVWLQLRNTAFSGGGVSTYPIAISGLGDTIIFWLSPIGKLFMRLIKMVIVPLVFASLLVGVASLGDVRKLGRLGGKTLGLYVSTTAVAVTIGLVCAHVINPGSFMSEESRVRLQAQFQGDAGSKMDAAVEAPSVIDNILNIIPDNPMESLSSGNMLQVIFFALIFGVALTLLSDKHGRPVVTFFDRVQEAMVVIIHMVMAIAPYGVAALIAEVVGTSGLSVLGSLLIYGVTVLIGLAIHATLVYGGLVRFVARLNIRDFLRAARPAQLIAFSTSSSSAALPVTMECAEQNLGVSNSVSSFVLPLGSTVNMDGTALYQGVAAIFIAQVFQIDLTLGAQLGIVLTATMASIGAAGVPGAGMVTLAMVLTASGIPPVGVALILGMDRLLDMFRTAVNVTGDLAVTATMAVSEGEILRPLSKSDDAASHDRGFEGRLDHEESVKPDS